MKIRTGFVSNSSSSSFIITNAQETKPPCECCGRPFKLSIETIGELLSNSLDDDNELDLITKDKKKLINHLAEEWCYSKNEARSFIEGLNIDQKVLLGSVSYHDKALNDLIYSNPTEIKVIHNFG